MLSGASVDVLCEHNALVSDAAKRSQVAEAWVRTKEFLIEKGLRVIRFSQSYDTCI